MIQLLEAQISSSCCFKYGFSALKSSQESKVLSGPDSVSLCVRGHGERTAVSQSYASSGAEQTHLHSAAWCASYAMAEQQRGTSAMSSGSSL